MPSEGIWLFALLLMAFSVCMTVAAGLGVSMIVCPAYLVSEKLSFLTFGQAEYILQGILFIGLCFAVRRFKPVYLSAFLSCLIYGFVLDLFQKFIPLFNVAKTPPESLHIAARIALLIGGMTLTSLAVALFFKAYLYPQVYDFFVKAIVTRYKLREGLTKTIFDLSFLALSFLLSFALFGSLVGIGWGTLAMAVCNGTLIGLFSKLFDRFFIAKPLFPKFAKLFEI
ncbi:MAG: hypothetical protein E7680_05175 [Ruminococcaceae bacterium]|nr:hypothetical protein [Oscillospiraceae bacterium]